MREAIRDIDRLRHIDECIGHMLVWETYTSDLPMLRKQIAQYIEELNNC